MPVKSIQLGGVLVKEKRIHTASYPKFTGFRPLQRSKEDRILCTGPVNLGGTAREALLVPLG